MVNRREVLEAVCLPLISRSQRTAAVTDLRGAPTAVSAISFAPPNPRWLCVGRHALAAKAKSQHG